MMQFAEISKNSLSVIHIFVNGSTGKSNHSTPGLSFSATGMSGIREVAVNSWSPALLMPKCSTAKGGGTWGHQRWVRTQMILITCLQAISERLLATPHPCSIQHVIKVTFVPAGDLGNAHEEFGCVCRRVPLSRHSACQEEQHKHVSWKRCSSGFGKKTCFFQMRE